MLFQNLNSPGGFVGYHHCEKVQWFNSVVVQIIRQVPRSGTDVTKCGRRWHVC